MVLFSHQRIEPWGRPLKGDTIGQLQFVNRRARAGWPEPDGNDVAARFCCNCSQGIAPTAAESSLRPQVDNDRSVGVNRHVIFDQAQPSLENHLQVPTISGRGHLQPEPVHQVPPCPAAIE